MIRAAQPSDAEAICTIYNQGIADRMATFETRERDADEIRGWFDPDMPFVVEVGDDGTVRGFARLTPASDRCVYRGIGDHAIYVRRDARGAGVGRRLLEELCAEAERRGFHKVSSRVFASNAASRALHRAAGFREVGVQERHGQLDGEWLDVVLVERLLGEAAAAAAKPRAA